MRTGGETSMAKTGKNDPAVLSALPAGAPVTAPRSEGPRPSRKAKGLSLTRRVTPESATATEVIDAVEWTRRPAKISGADGEVVFKMDDAEVPAGWSQLATDVGVEVFPQGGRSYRERRGGVGAPARPPRRARPA